jgi:hypothetical protein
MITNKQNKQTTPMLVSFYYVNITLPGDLHLKNRAKLMHWNVPLAHTITTHPHNPHPGQRTQKPRQEARTMTTTRRRDH